MSISFPRLLTTLAFCLALAIPTISSRAQSDDCPAGSALGASVEPSPCVPAGVTFTVRLQRFAPGQLVSVILAGASGPVGGGDRAVRLGSDGRLGLDTRDFGGQAIASGDYRIWIKDITGHYPPAFVDVRIAGAVPTAAVIIPTTPVVFPTPSSGGTTFPGAPLPTLAGTTSPTTTFAPGLAPSITPTRGTATATSQPVGTATPTGGSADLLTQCIDREPAFVDGPTAWVTNENPRRGETIAVCARLRRDNQPVAGASVYARVQYQTTERELGPQPTGSEGIAALPVDIGTATSGVVVPVYVEIETNEEFFEASTEFIPQ